VCIVKKKPHYLNENNNWECRNCEPLLSDSEEESSDNESYDSSFINDSVYYII